MSDSESEGFLDVVSDDDDDFDDDSDDDLKKKKRKNNKKEKEVKNKKIKTTNEKPKPSPKKKSKVEAGVPSQSQSAGVKPQKLALNHENAAVSSVSAPQKSVSSNMKGPAVSTPLEARNLVRDYMLQQNRPYSAIQIHDNLHGRVAKPQLQRGTPLWLSLICYSCHLLISSRRTKRTRIKMLPASQGLWEGKDLLF